MFIQTEATPNPATLKFIPGRAVLDTGTMEFTDRDSATRSPLAERLFGVPGVTGVFYGSDFVTVTKDDSDWQHLKPAILGVIMEHYMSGAPLLADGSAANDEASDEEGEFFNEQDADISVLVLAASVGPEGPGPIITMLAKTAGTFPIPITVVPGNLGDIDIDALS